ncbi:hypothetical protein ATANTOWER_005069 [Ataeniobius toweri]|uniref:Uncharacterized protein n=1 Tax=Ataeniobius toweri TaxID=208326 RepID=A0ABU7CEP2_9TELE|nr:hypothetical protein [Ataeniobius toweri]
MDIMIRMLKLNFNLSTHYSMKTLYWTLLDWVHYCFLFGFANFYGISNDDLWLNQKVVKDSTVGASDIKKTASIISNQKTHTSSVWLPQHPEMLFKPVLLRSINADIHVGVHMFND